MSSSHSSIQEEFQAFMTTTPKNNNNNNNNNSSSSSKKKKKKRQDTCTPRNNNNNRKNNNNNNNNSSSSSGKKKSNKKQQEQEETAVAVIPKHVYNAKRRYWQLFRAFCIVVEEDFIKNDKHLGEVVASIENVRRCIHATSRQQQQYSDNNAVYPMWQQYGYRSSTRDESTFSTITWLDIEETLTHDMQQHERLLSGLGSLLKQLYEAQEAMGRRLEDMYNHHLDVTMDTNMTMTNTNDDIHVCVYLGDCALLLEKMQDCHHACANELFRKQGLCERLFDSCTDDLLDESSSSSSNESLSKRVAEQCARECLETNCIHLQSWQEICALKKG